MIANSISIQLLENIISEKIKIFGATEYFSLSKEEIVEVYKEEYFTDWTEQEFANAACNFNIYKDNFIVLIIKAKKNQSQRDVINMKDSTIHLREDGVKRRAVSWEEALFLVYKTPEGEHHYPNLKEKDEHCICDILAIFF